MKTYEKIMIWVGLFALGVALWFVFMGAEMICQTIEFSKFAHP